MRISDWSSDVCSSDLIAIIPMNEVVRGVALQDVAVDRSAQCQRLECDIRPDGAIGEVHFCDTEPANTIVIEMTNYANTVAICRAQQQIVDRKSTRLNSSH